MTLFKFSFIKICLLVFGCVIISVKSSSAISFDQLDEQNVKPALISIDFPLDMNPSMTEVAHVFKGKGNLYYVTLPLSLDSTLSNVRIISTKNSKIQIDDRLLATNLDSLNGEEVSVSYGIIDISKSNNIQIISDNGLVSNVELLAQKGIWQIDSLVYEFKEKYNIPGISVAVANMSQSTTAYKSGYGYAIEETKTRTLPSHLFRLASMSKQHAAICILKLIEEGHFGIDDYVFGTGGILENDFPVVPDRASRITVRHLLEHTSGYSRSPDYIYSGKYSGWSTERRIRTMLKARQPNEPGTVYAYYNTGYAILGYIIESVSGKSYEQYLRDLYATVGIEGIQVGGTKSERRENEVSYYSQNGSSSNGADMDIRASSGGLIASTEDLFKLLWAIDGNPNIPDLLSKETVDMMFSASKVGESRYALGWRTNHNFFPESFYHGGTLAGVATFWIYSKDYAAVVLCNSRSYRGKFDDELYKMAAQMIEEAKLLGL